MMAGNESPRRHVPRWASTLAVVTLAVVVLVPGPWRAVEQVGSTVLAPIQMGVAVTAGEINAVLGALPRVRELASKDLEYRQEIDRLSSELVRMRELEVENRDLRNLLSLKERTGPGSLLPVSVIARDDTPYVEAITIDRGVTGGVREGSIVVTHKGLVGKVTRVNPTTAKVLLVTDINHQLSVRLQTDARTTGVLRGQGRGNSLVIEHIPQADTVNVGDLVITSGLGEVYPEGLVVGSVLRVERKAAEPLQAAAVEPAVDPNKLERLYVLADR